MIYFEPQSTFFYDSEMHKAIPANAVEVTEGEYRQLFERQSEGYRIVVGLGGKPEALPPSDDAKEYVSRKQAKSQGKLIAGVKISLNEENQNGIASVMQGANLAAEVGAPFFPLNFNAMTATGEQMVTFADMPEFKAFALEFMAARQQFF